MLLSQNQNKQSNLNSEKQFRISTPNLKNLCLHYPYIKRKINPSRGSFYTNNENFHKPLDSINEPSKFCKIKTCQLSQFSSWNSSTVFPHRATFTAPSPLISSTHNLFVNTLSTLSKLKNATWPSSSIVSKAKSTSENGSWLSTMTQLTNKPNKPRSSKTWSFKTSWGRSTQDSWISLFLQNQLNELKVGLRIMMRFCSGWGLWRFWGRSWGGERRGKRKKWSEIGFWRKIWRWKIKVIFKRLWNEGKARNQFKTKKDKLLNKTTFFHFKKSWSEKEAFKTKPEK